MPKKKEIITLYNNKYWDATFSYACELLEQHDGISISPSALTNILYKEYIFQLVFYHNQYYLYQEHLLEFL